MPPAPPAPNKDLGIQAKPGQPSVIQNPSMHTVGAPAFDGTIRVGLIIANVDYASVGFASLPGVKSDRVTMEDALKKTGFSVTVVVDATRAQILDAVSIFAQNLRAAGTNGVGFLYYSGHGAVEYKRGAVYLIPVDARVIASPAFGEKLIASSSVTNDQILDILEPAAGRGLIVVFDACRTQVPIIELGPQDRDSLKMTPQSTASSFVPQRGVPGSVGSAIKYPPVYTIFYATMPGNPASDTGIVAREIAAAIEADYATSKTAFEEAQRSIASRLPQAPSIYDNGTGAPLVFVNRLKSFEDIVYRTEWDKSDDIKRQALARLAEILADPALRPSPVALTRVCNDQIGVNVAVSRLLLSGGYCKQPSK